jgi:hypothetical protein
MVKIQSFYTLSEKGTNSRFFLDGEMMKDIHGIQQQRALI